VIVPRNKETDWSVTCAVLHVDPLELEDSKATSGAVVAGYADGPRLEAGVPRASGGRPGFAITAEPAPTHAVGR
jgi:hypothetical protein